MNALYVNIKVDREERPDIDHLYMSALHALGEQGGWPLTMFLAPDGAPFWGGTYFPPEPRWGRPSFRQVLQGVADTYRADTQRIMHNTDALRRALLAASAARPGSLPLPGDLDRAAGVLLGLTDPIHGGLRGAPKFPNPPIFRFLWQNDFRTGNDAGRDAVHLMLLRMSQGGIYDHLGGGFSRYATDEVWLVPHFEKMLYDNAQLLELLAFAHADRPDALYAERAAETVEWLVRDMTATEATAFASSEDADSEGEEGRFYVWSEAQIVSHLGLAAPPFMAAYDVTPDGNWEGHNILRRIGAPEPEEHEEKLARSRAVLFAARERRIRPGRDDKVLADWNGLAIAALARASAVFARPDWLVLAERAFDFILGAMGAPDGRVRHAWRLGRVTAAGLIEDQAAMARAALALFEATGTARYLNEAIGLAGAAARLFGDEHGAFYQTAADATDVPLNRPRSAADNATPAGNGQMTEVLARLFHLTGDEAYRSQAAGVLRAFTGQPDQFAAMPTLLAAADLLEGATTVVIAGPADHKLAQALIEVTLIAPDPTVVLLRAASAEALPPSHPAHGKIAGPAGAAAYVCRAGVCGLPVTDPAELAAKLRRRA